MQLIYLYLFVLRTKCGILRNELLIVYLENKLKFGILFHNKPKSGISKSHPLSSIRNSGEKKITQSKWESHFDIMLTHWQKGKIENAGHVQSSFVDLIIRTALIKVFNV